MRRFLCGLLVGLLLAAPVLAEDRVTVFRDLAWGDPVAVLGDAVLARQSKDISASLLVGLLETNLFGTYGEEFRSGITLDVFMRSDEQLALGSLTVRDILYGFLNDKLAAIYVSSENKRRFGDVLRARYGEPHRTTTHTENWTLQDGSRVEFWPESGALYLTGPEWATTRREIARRYRDQVEVDARAW